MKLAVIGSRKFPDPDRVRALVRGVEAGTVIVSGGAEGPDSWAVEAAKERGLAYQVFPARWGELGRAAGLIRNQDIVDQADRLVAFWDLKSRGTKDTINKALAAGKVVTIVPPALPFALDYEPPVPAA
mgnify:CR=1 FL=1